MSNEQFNDDYEPQMIGAGIYAQEPGPDAESNDLEYTSLLIPGDGDVERALTETKDIEKKIADLNASLVTGDLNAHEAEKIKKEIESLNDDRFGTGGMHTARNMENATGWREGSQPTKQADPEGIRDFKGDEFRGFIAYAHTNPEGTGQRVPAFWSHFTQVQRDENGVPLEDENGAYIPLTDDKGEPLPITHQDQLDGQKYKVYLPGVPGVADGKKMPDELSNHPNVRRIRDAWGYNGDPKEKAQPISPKAYEVLKEWVKESEHSGVPVEIVDNFEACHVTMMGWDQGRTSGLLGIASFPDYMNNWARLRGLGMPRGKAFAFINNSYCEKRADKNEIRDLILHESMRGHNMGGCHSHDLAQPVMTEPECHGKSLMAYADIHRDNPLGLQGGSVGAVDFGARDWVPNPPELNTGDDNEYDLSKVISQEAYDANKSKRSAMRIKEFPMEVIINHGDGAVLKGTQGDDLLDANQGYCSVVTTPAEMGPQFKVKVMLKEGHIERVKGVAGNNKIIPSVTGNQTIEPGVGENSIHFYGQSLSGDKTIVSEGKDTLVLSENILMAHTDLNAQQAQDPNSNDDYIVLNTGDKGKITLKGKGLDKVRIVGNTKKELLEVNVSGMNAEELNEVLRVARQTVRGGRGPREGTFAESIGTADERREANKDNGRAA